MTALETAAVYTGGFAEPVVDSQAIFRAVLAALAEPACPVACRPRAFAPAPLTPMLASIALALADQESPLWLDPALATNPAIPRWLAFHTGASVVAEPSDATFAFVTDPARLPTLSTFAQGTADYPDRSTTVVVAVDGFEAEGPRYTGPGFDAPRRFRPLPTPVRLATEVAANRTLFPRGVDLLFVTANAIAALPRSVRIVEG